MTIFVTGVNIIEESMKMFEQSMKTSMDIMNSLGQPVPENVEQTDAGFDGDDSNINAKCACCHVNDVYPIYLS